MQLGRRSGYKQDFLDVFKSSTPFQHLKRSGMDRIQRREDGNPSDDVDRYVRQIARAVKTRGLDRLRNLQIETSAAYFSYTKTVDLHSRGVV